MTGSNKKYFFDNLVIFLKTENMFFRINGQNIIYFDFNQCQKI